MDDQVPMDVGKAVDGPPCVPGFVALADFFVDPVLCFPRQQF